ncbi:MAG: MraY family glycosyltransferase [Planctomycetota bacterium]|nr:MraY family glycosyltransferase [Planctomycetota bacterium]
MSALSVSGSLGLWTGLVTAAVLTPLLARLARRLGWLDRAEGPSAARKSQGRPVPPVGGTAVLLGLFAAWLAIRVGGGHWDPVVAAWIHPLAGALALLGAFGAGLVDDLRRHGLAPGTKLALQSAAALPVGISVLHHGFTTQDEVGLGLLLFACGLFLAAVLAQNAFNTFDNNDGCATSLGMCALGFTAPVLAGALVGFLPYNLNARRAHGRRGAPTAYLGDSGSHLLGMLVLVTPAAWPAFALPVLDLARVALRRWREGRRPWTADRSHLAHRLAAAGIARPVVAALLVLVALPSIVLGAFGIIATAMLFVVAVRATPESV